ncbi:MAG: dehydrogenase [Cyanobacteria bacterium CYA]|nr:MAG: dehydrogenase [Cyanobacteria bacterium CYA]
MNRRPSLCEDARAVFGVRAQSRAPNVLVPREASFLRRRVPRAALGPRPGFTGRYRPAPRSDKGHRVGPVARSGLPGLIGLLSFHVSTRRGMVAGTAGTSMFRLSGVAGAAAGATTTAVALVIVASIAARSAPKVAGPGQFAPHSAALPGQWDQSPVRSPAQALAGFDVAPGFEVSLFASEPMIEDPVAMAFDEDGRLWVVEMQSYMPNIEGDGELSPTSRVVVLEDTDGDGRADRDTVFLDGLVLPRAILPCHGGALVIEPPNLLFCRDTDADGRADEKKVILTGFDGHENPEHAGNALRWGLDNWIHLSQFEIDIRFDGQKAITRPVPRVGQWGMTFDDSGRACYTPNSDSLYMDYVPKHYRPRNDPQGGLRGVYARVGRDVAVFSARPNTGVNRGYRTAQLRADGRLATLTSACGPAMYNADLFGPEFAGNVFLCEPAANIIKRIVPRERNGLPYWVNAYSDDEFLTSTDERFRPVDAQVAPDGSLFVCDMYRGIIQHRTYLTEYLAGEIRARGLETPLGLGRIYRIAPTGAPVMSPRKLSEATNTELVELLGHPNQQQRVTAQRLLIERRATDAGGALESLLFNSENPLARLHALRTLEGVGQLSQRDVLLALADADPRVVAHACEIAESMDPFEVLDALVRAAQRPERLLRVQAALSLGALQTEGAREALVGLARAHAGDEFMRSAIVNSLAGHEVEAAAMLLVDESWPGDAADRAMMAELLDTGLRSGNAADVLDLCVRLAANSPARAEAILARVASVQKLGEQRPRTLRLAREPRGWTELVLAGSGHLSEQAGRSDRFLAWPGRPDSEKAALTSDQRLLLARGAQVYVYCQGCHGSNGQGMGVPYPPLADSPRVARRAH